MSDTLNDSRLLAFLAAYSTAITTSPAQSVAGTVPFLERLVGAEAADVHPALAGILRALHAALHQYDAAHTALVRLEGRHAAEHDLEYELHESYSDRNARAGAQANAERDAQHALEQATAEVRRWQTALEDEWAVQHEALRMSRTDALPEDV